MGVVITRHHRERHHGEHPQHPQQQQEGPHSGPESIRVSEALSGESTQEVGGDATNDAYPNSAAEPASQPPGGSSSSGSSMASAADTAPLAPAIDASDPQGDAMRTAMEDEGTLTHASTATGGGSASGEQLKEVTLRTAPQDARFPTTNQSRRCYVAYNEYHKCIKERGQDSGDCKPYMRAYRSICPDEWIEKWNELRDEGKWYGKY